MGWLKHIVLAIALFPVGSGVVALGLIASQGPDPAIARAALSADGSDTTLSAGLETFTARDGETLGYRVWGDRTRGPVVIALHGAAGHSLWMESLGTQLAAGMAGLVIAPDLRGHGPAPRRRGDIDYIGQLEDDIADLIDHIGRDGRPLGLVGHSAGGGLAIRFAGGQYGHLLDRAVLIAPFLQHDAPTVLPPAPEGWARPLVRRIAGLVMLNAAGITALNHLVVVEFNIPQDLRDAPGGSALTARYSHRLQFSLSPRHNWQADVAALPGFLVVAGSADTTFDADAFEPAMSPHNRLGTYAILDGAGHADILGHPELAALIADFVSGP